MNAHRLTTHVLLGFLVGAFLLACQPRTRDVIPSSRPDHESTLLQRSGFPVEVVLGRALKGKDLQSERRLWASKVSGDCGARTVFVPVFLQHCVIRYDEPATGSFLIRSPPRRSPRSL